MVKAHNGEHGIGGFFRCVPNFVGALRVGGLGAKAEALAAFVFQPIADFAPEAEAVRVVIDNVGSVEGGMA
jgi:hypothetical protein